MTVDFKNIGDQVVMIYSGTGTDSFGIVGACLLNLGNLFVYF